MANGEDNRNPSVYSNRKRKANNSRNRIKQIKVKNDGQSYTLNEAANSKDNTKVNVSFHKFKKFDSEEYEDSEPTFIEPIQSNCKQSAEDDDCIITNEPSTPIIDLSVDVGPECQEGSNKMIELIWCEDVEPEPSDMKEYVIELSNELEDQEIQQPLNINFTTFRAPEDDASQSIDLTNEQNNEIVDCEGERMLTIDLTSEQISEEETNVDVVNSSTEVIEQITQKMNSRFPGAVQSISWNVATKQFEVSISKKNGFKMNNAFHQYLREVVNHQPSKLTNNEASSGPVTGNVILNKDYAQKQQEMKKCLETYLVNTLNRSTSPSPDTLLQLPESSQLTSKIQIVSNYNASQILKKSESYLGVTVETFQRIENLLEDRFKNRSVLILLLRKIKLNEPFPILSDVLCPNQEDCIKIYKEFLIEVSRTLEGFHRWPSNCRDSLAIVDIFEIEIKKPNSFIKQSVSFCSQSQRYVVKFIICCTSTGYIFHVSMPFHSIQKKILLSSFASIPKSSSVVVNPNLLHLGQKIISSARIASLFDCNHFAERNLIQRVFDRLRRFSLINSSSDLKNVNLLKHTVSVVASLCNLEEER